MQRIDEEKNVLYYYLKDDGTFPNNDRLPVLFFKKALPKNFFNGDAEIRELLMSNGWEKSWTDNIYDYHHYHSTAHEVLVAIEGETSLLLGGEQGVTVHFEKGDALVIPAGVAHKNLEPDKRFYCVGAYPAGQDFDMNYGRTNERDIALRNIGRLALPKTDPLSGHDGPLMKYWVAVQQASANG